MRVLVTLTDVEPAVRLNAMLEAAGYETTLVSPIDNLRAAIKRESPDLVVLTGGLIDTANVQLVRDLLWDGIAVVGLADLGDPAVSERLPGAGFGEVFEKAGHQRWEIRRLRKIIGARETGIEGDAGARSELAKPRAKMIENQRFGCAEPLHQRRPASTLAYPGVGRGLLHRCG